MIINNGDGSGMSRERIDLKGKKILLLGGHVLMIHIIQKAHEMGIYTIVTDYIPDAPAKKYADEAYDISTLDVNALVQLAKEKHVDGVFTGYVDINLAPCCMVCERLGLPFYATLEQLEQTMNKVNFKNNCRKFGIPVVEDVAEELLDGVYDRFMYPVIVKPADSYSSKGISVCNRKEEMKEALQKAMGQSGCKQILVERYIEADDVYLYFTVQDGYVSLSAMADRLLNDEQYGCAPQPVGYFFPSKYLDVYYEKVHLKVQNMMAALGIKNGSFFMQGFAMDDNIVFFEMGLRLSGGAGYLQIAHQNKIDQREMHLRYAITGKFDGWKLREYDDARFKAPACVVVILLKNGKLTNIIGLDMIMDNENVFDIIQFKKIGDVLKEKGTLNQVFARIFCSAQTEEELKKTISTIKSILRILDENGSNMILNLFDEDGVY